MDTRLQTTTHEATVAFLLSELSIAATHLDIAENADDPKTTNQSVIRARQAYGVVEKLLPLIDLTKEEAGKVQAGMDRMLLTGLLSPAH